MAGAASTFAPDAAPLALLCLEFDPNFFEPALDPDLDPDFNAEAPVHVKALFGFPLCGLPSTCAAPVWSAVRRSQLTTLILFILSILLFAAAATHDLDLCDDFACDSCALPAASPSASCPSASPSP